METKRDIQDIEDVKLLVNTFYERVQKDPSIGPIFNDQIQDRWPEHLEIMYRFWQTILLGEPTYSGTPFAPHARLPIAPEHFDLWLKMFYETLDTLFEGERVKEAKWRSFKMAEMFNMKLEYFRNNDNLFPIV